MNKRICVYTCITGDYDNLSEINNPEKNIDYLCFTNNKQIKSKTWKIIYIQNNNLNNHLLSRKIKMLGHSIISKNYDISIWMDASVTWEKSITAFVEKYLKDAPFAAFKHSQRKTIQEEAVACLLYHKDTKNNILRTLNYLKSENFPDNLGLYEMTVFIKRHNDKTVKKTMELWFATNKEYSKRDQLSFMYAAWKTGLKIDTINLNVWDNGWFTNSKHNSQTTIDSIGLYYGDISSPFILDNYYDIEPIQKHGIYNIKQAPPINCKIITIILPYIPGLKISDIDTTASIKQIEPINATKYHNDYIFLLSNCILKLHGDFKENHFINLSFRLGQMQYLDLINYVAKNCIDNRTLIRLRNDNQALRNENNLYSQTIKNQQTLIDSYSQTIKNIYNSKSWRIIQKAKRLFPPSKR